MTPKPDLKAALEPLKGFQRDTVAHVTKRLWKDADATDRFLVADEVGLGKTLVARGVIAETIEHLWEIEDRSDIVYICSNAQIAQQNLAKLVPEGVRVPHADRLSLLLHNIAEFQGNKLNYISFTPGTSFTVKETSGLANERVLLYHLLQRGWSKDEMSSTAWPEFFRCGVAKETFTRRLKAFDTAGITDAVALEFVNDLENEDPIDSDYESLAAEVWDLAMTKFRWLRKPVDKDTSRYRNRLIGRMRNLVAHASIRALEPDLIILDEFHRFKALLDEDNDEADLAKALFNQDTAKVLMLSATPFSMYTLPDDEEGAGHYDDFLATVRFLFGGRANPADVSVQIDTLAQDLATMRSAARLGAGSRGAGLAARDRVQGTLTDVMSRVERLGSTPDRDGMLVEVPMPVPVTGGDLLAYAGGQSIADAVGRGRGGRDIFELWRSSPYLFNIMENYQVKQGLGQALNSPDPQARAAVEEALRNASGLLDWDVIDRYQPLDAGNAKMRALIADTIDRGAWQLAWLPPSLPYYSPGGAFADPLLQGFTKRLVFSAWAVAPKAIASVLSYQAEQRGIAAIDPERRYAERGRTAFLRRPRNDGNQENMASEALFQPCVVLSELCDPLVLAQELGDGVPAVEAVLSIATERVQSKLDALLPGLDISSSRRSSVDPSWYWAAPILLDMQAYPDYTEPPALPDYYGKPDAPTELDVSALGAIPADLARVLAELALAGPANCLLRGLRRATGSVLAYDDDELWNVTLDTCDAFRSLFNQSEIAAAIRHAQPDLAPWQAALRHCLDGNLQSVLDEYLALGGVERFHDAHDPEAAASGLVAAMSIQAGGAGVDVFDLSGGEVSMRRPLPIRHHFAMRLGQRGSQTEQTQARAADVLASFNSPFWPFVVASTSVGQEGLDFHNYSRAVVHWNLPGNPVDLEQREGRVHRFRGHAIRRNIASVHADAALRPGCVDPWAAMFDAAEAAKSPTDSDLVPDWVFAPPGGAKIERYVPAMPLSRETAQYQRLLRTVAAYRMTLGQPRQEDLVRYLDDGEADGEVLRLDLAPPSRG
ncbi:helicase-related protein [Tomitella biformata]|uniref:helicase-related protein n=1 Tax=Tomitella biformata TaxID=630403 RepID=UPI0004677BAB|nr:helicase-related protein [Tomitella biformata]